MFPPLGKAAVRKLNGFGVFMKSMAGHPKLKGLAGPERAKALSRAWARASDKDKQILTLNPVMVPTKKPRPQRRLSKWTKYVRRQLKGYSGRDMPKLIKVMAVHWKTRRAAGQKR